MRVSVRLKRDSCKVQHKTLFGYGEPKRLRTAELSNWTGKAVAGPRSEFESLLLREESQKSGVYFLTGNDPESGKLPCTLAKPNVFATD